MKKQIPVICLINILLIGVYAGCVEVTQRDGALFSNGNNQPWEDGTITLQYIKYEEKYDSSIGDYRIAAIQFKIDFDVYINTKIQSFKFRTSKGQTLYPSCWVMLEDGEATQSSMMVLPYQGSKNCGDVTVGPNDGDLWIDIGKYNSPGSFVLYLYYSESSYSYIEPDETITSFTFSISDSYGSNEYTFPVEEDLIPANTDEEKIIGTWEDNHGGIWEFKNDGTCYPGLSDIYNYELKNGRLNILIGRNYAWVYSYTFLYLDSIKLESTDTKGMLQQQGYYQLTLQRIISE
jgi:hypothetical protein